MIEKRCIYIELVIETIPDESTLHMQYMQIHAPSWSTFSCRQYVNEDGGRPSGQFLLVLLLYFD